MALILQILVPIHRRPVGLRPGAPLESRQRARADRVVDEQRLARAELRRFTLVP